MATKPVKTKTSKSKDIKKWLNPTSPGKKMLLFVLVFAILGGAYMTYKSFAVSAYISHLCIYPSGQPISQSYNIVYGNTGGASRDYKVVFRHSSFSGSENPSYVAALGKSGSTGYFKTGVYVANNRSGSYYLYYRQPNKTEYNYWASDNADSVNCTSPT